MVQKSQTITLGCWDVKNPINNGILTTKLQLVSFCRISGCHQQYVGQTFLPSSKLTWQWKIPIFNREYIFNWSIFHCHVTLPEGTTFYKNLKHLFFKKKYAEDTPLWTYPLRMGSAPPGVDGGTHLSKTERCGNKNRLERKMKGSYPSGKQDEQ